jgi:hypothetical protein
LIKVTSYPFTIICQNHAAAAKRGCWMNEGGGIILSLTANIIYINNPSLYKMNKKREKRSYKTNVPYISGTPIKKIKIKTT